jgi:hypothetical protein
MRIDPLGKRERHFAAKRWFRFGPMEAHPEMGATRAAAQAGMHHGDGNEGLSARARKIR